MASPFSDFTVVLRHVQTRLLVADLKDILKDLGLSCSGNKRPLIERVLSHLNLLKDANDVARYNSLKHKILRCGAASPALSTRPHTMRTPTYTPPHPLAHQASPLGMHYGQLAGSARPVHYPPQQLTLNFKPSPFYEVVERLSNTAALPYSARNTVCISFICSNHSLDLLQRQPAHYKVAMMCADSSLSYIPNRQLLMEYPNPSEISVNSRRVNANLKGMKNKPGTVPPADITNYMDRTPRLANRLDITYSSGSDIHKKFGAQVALLRVHSVDELVQRILAGNRFSKESVLEKLRKPEDDEIQMASFDLTLKDPLSYMRITVPCRSVFCKHNQCWDAMAFLSINEQTPQWSCPICHTAINGLEGIAVDGYFQDILDKVNSDVDTILVDPLGNWKIPGEDKPSNIRDQSSDNKEGNQEVLDLGDTEDEETEIPLARVKQLKEESSSRASTPNVATQSTKRKVPPVCIDLTEDSDDEPEIPKRVKHSESMDTTLALPRSSGPLPSMPLSNAAFSPGRSRHYPQDLHVYADPARTDGGRTMQTDHTPQHSQAIDTGSVHREDTTHHPKVAFDASARGTPKAWNDPGSDTRSHSFNKLPDYPGNPSIVAGEHYTSEQPPPDQLQIPASMPNTTVIPTAGTMTGGIVPSACRVPRFGDESNQSGIGGTHRENEPLDEHLVPASVAIPHSLSSPSEITSPPIVAPGSRTYHTSAQLHIDSDDFSDGWSL